MTKLFNTFRLIAPILFTAVFVVMPLFTLAQAPTNVIQPAPTNVIQQSNSNFSIQNPLKVDSFCKLVEIILQALMVIGLPVAVLFLVWVGFKFILAQGDPGKLTDARRNLFNTVIGIAIFLGAWTIAIVLSNTMKALGVTGFNQCS